MSSRDEALRLLLAMVHSSLIEAPWARVPFCDNDRAGVREECTCEAEGEGDRAAQDQGVYVAGTSDGQVSGFHRRLSTVEPQQLIVN